ncbi:hypothetical protein [Peribacillus loiseleuriae]|uniref:hypothetical protein n=1 Tax=Peribacillus loiseleuriae TaxID=1679170 RepID=UPI003D02A722
MSQVTVWYMTEEERLAYIEKHPIRSETPIGKSGKAYEWRGKKAAASRKSRKVMNA